MPNSARTSSASTALTSSPAAHPHPPATRVMPLATAAPIDPPGITDAQLMREEVEALCSHMLWLRSWWQAHGDGIRAADRKAASSVHDHFIDGAMFARGVARKAGFDMREDYIKDYSWGRCTQTMRVIVRGAK